MAICWRITEVRVLESYPIRVHFTDSLVGVMHFPPDFLTHNQK